MIVIQRHSAGDIKWPMVKFTASDRGRVVYVGAKRGQHIIRIASELQRHGLLTDRVFMDLAEDILAGKEG